MDLNDELLCAYLDGELPPAERAACESALAADPGARQRLARLRHADEQLRGAFPLDANPAEDPLVARILATDSSTEPAPTMVTPVVAPRRRPGWHYALAAGIAAATIGLVLVGGQAYRARDQQATLAAVLEHVPSGQTGRADGVSVTPEMSFKVADGRWCRVFQRDLETDASSSEGLACREGREWKVLALEPRAASGAGGLRPAGGESGSVDAAMNRLGGETSLDEAQEKALIERGWRDGPR